ncbi:hypothetical protein BDN72DRAFT_809109 [Pluteus cervinus]|uniref:Uncharacterized protein n=1 Tax=Pluteus cervinus TaxID=181527 RepID=A0ACD3BEN3_9AGAR|nr:hypothetical protein BDN72DRAFT_809109 [Pluteus cervinus]
MLSDLHDPASQAYKKARRQYLKATKHRDPALEADWTPFRAAEKRFKARFPPPDLSNVLDLALLDPARGPEIERGTWRGAVQPGWSSSLNTEPGTVYSIPRVPGLVILPNFVAPRHQRHLIRWALSDHAKLPNETNLDTHYHLPPSGIWNTYLDDKGNLGQPTMVQPKAISAASVDTTPPGPRQLINNVPASPATLQSISNEPKEPQPPSATIQPATPEELVPKLRWANIGWFYHWGTKQYDFTQGPGHIRDDVRRLCKDAVASVDWAQVFDEEHSADWGEQEPDWRSWKETYEPDAGIVNFYQIKDTLMAHVDRSEVCATSPLVSISLGNAAIFLIGGVTRDEDPVPILLRSGDVVIMSGPGCRRAYHGVPRILEGTMPPHFDSDPDGEEWKLYSDYMHSTRINVNVRQVFPKGFDPTTTISSVSPSAQG